MTGQRAALEEAEVALLAALGDGLTHEQAGRRLGISARTLRRRLDGVCSTLGVATPMQAVVQAAKGGLI